MNKIIKSTPEEKAYNLGWVAFYLNKSIKNIYDLNEKPRLYEKWEDGFRFAKYVEN